MPLKLILIRHAKSTWANPGVSDFDRDLNDRGKADAPAMGKTLLNIGISPDLIISSAAKRAHQTAKKIALAIGYEVDNIKCVEKLYHCVPPVFEELICNVSDSVKTLFLVAHNPGITGFVNQLSREFRIDDMPTCGVVGVTIESNHWKEFPVAGRNVFLYQFPGKYDDK